MLDNRLCIAVLLEASHERSHAAAIMMSPRPPRLPSSTYLSASVPSSVLSTASSIRRTSLGLIHAASRSFPAERSSSIVRFLLYKSEMKTMVYSNPAIDHPSRIITILLENMQSTVIQHLEVGTALNWHRAEHIFAIFTRISLAAILFLRYWPRLTRTDVYKISVVISMSVMTFITLNAYVIRTKVISYTRDAILGPKIFGAPIEELLVVVLQTFITSLFCMLFTHRTNYNFTQDEETDLRRKRDLGFVVLLNLFAIGLPLWLTKGMYLGLLLIWYTPLLAILWDIAYPFLLRMPLSNMLVPVVLPTLFFCWVGRGKGRLVDEKAETGVSWNELVIEEAVFFLLNSIFVEWGHNAVDYIFATLSQLAPFPNYI